jgi:hypothetical protein
MQLPDIKDLGKVIDLCQKKGVKVFQLGELRLELGDPPAKPQRTIEQSENHSEMNPDDPWAEFPNGVLSPEQLMFYSSGGKPGQEPWLEKKEKADE